MSWQFFKMIHFWDTAPCSLVEVDLRCASCLHHQGGESMVQVVRTSETSVYFNETARCCVPEACHLRTRRRENLKSHIGSFYLNFALCYSGQPQNASLGSTGTEERTRCFLSHDQGTEIGAARLGRALPPGKGPPVPIVQEAGSASELVWTQRLKRKSFASTGDRTPVVLSSETILTELYWTQNNCELMKRHSKRGEKMERARGSALANSLSEHV
jgi:hypothetical protein